MTSRRGGVSDGFLLGGLVTIVAAAGGVWLAAALGGYLEHGRWPRVGIGDAALAVPSLVADPGDPEAAWPEAVRADLPGGGLFYGLLGLLIVVAVALGAVVARLWIRRGRFADGDRERRKSIERAYAARPGARGPGVSLGRDTAHGIVLRGSAEDSYLVVGPPRSGKGAHVVVGAILDAPGVVVATSTRPETYRHTVDARERHGPVHVFDPNELTDRPRRLRWAPERGCADPPTALRRARALAADLRGAADPALSTEHVAAQTVLRCYLHAAALDGRPIGHVLKWAADPADPEPVRVLSQSSGATPGWAEEMAELAASPDRTQVWAAVRRSLSFLADPRAVEACSPSRSEIFDVPTFLGDGATLYLVGTGSGETSVAPLIAAIVEDVVEHVRRVTARSPDGRLDPPAVLMLDDAASIAPLPTLPTLLAEGGAFGITSVVVLQSLAQARARWGAPAADALWDGSTVRIALGEPVDPGGGRGGDTGDTERDGAGTLPFGTARVLRRGAPPVTTRLTPWWERP